MTAKTRAERRKRKKLASKIKSEKYLSKRKRKRLKKKERKIKQKSLEDCYKADRLFRKTLNPTLVHWEDAPPATLETFDITQLAGCSPEEIARCLISMRKLEALIHRSTERPQGKR